MSITRLLKGVLPVILALTCLLTGCTIGDTDYVLDMDYVGRNDVLEINGEAITKEEALLYLCNYQNLYGEEYGLDLWQAQLGTSGLTLEEYIKEITLLQISDITCMSQLATQMGVTLTQAEEETLAVVAKEYYNTLTQEELSYIGIDEKTLLATYRKYAQADKLYHQLTSGINEEVSLDEARVLRLQTIYVSSEETANEILSKLEAGKNFLTLTNSY
ncbi:MAG: peptidyl-prolyl cis-trans isomerase, partial [Agathobacter sp.]|nr:peptidyl-prolyl cis-trans isomerase [Agathobacter sp.]